MAFWVTGAAFTREAAVGVILVIGLAVNQAILLVDGVLQRSRQAGTPSARTAVRADIILAACRDRAGMIMLVTLTTLASLIPLAVDTGADDLFGAIALATAGGTVAGTLGAMLLLPPMLVRRGKAIGR
ncbi:MAG: efflux RND transporter permease subunit [Gemmatimonadetes bacterium]|nr:efflux RND transporter permease subunit [Gemmatimonadota bacterium]